MQNKLKPQKQNSGNIYMDAAIEALRQNAENDDTFSYLLITNSKKSSPAISQKGERELLANAIADLIAENHEFDKLIHVSLMMYEFNKNPKRVLNLMASLFDKEDQEKE